MSGAIPLFELNFTLNRKALGDAFRDKGRVQIRNLLTEETARNIHRILERETSWGLAWRAGGDGPHGISGEAFRSMTPQQLQGIMSKIAAASRSGEYAFLYAQHRMLDAYLERWAPGSPHDLLVEHINDAPLLELVREVTGIGELIKGDAQGTLYAPNHFLAAHDDSHMAEGWRVAYVMSFCAEEWRPEWGGHLLFLSDDGDVIDGFCPRFNALTLFRVPQKHLVSYVAPFAPVARFAITGWFRDH